jgi:surface antigen
MRLRSIIAGLSAAALMVATISPAFADDHGGHHRHGHSGYNNNDYSDCSRNYSNNRYNDYYSYNNGYYDSYGNDRKRRHDDDDDDDVGTAIGIGLGVVGLALLVGAISSDDEDKSHDDRQRHSNNRDGWYRSEVNHNSDGKWRNRDDFAYRSYQNNITQFSSNQCLETREYQTRIIVDGRNRDAYGASCLTRNGQWVQGPLQLVPEDR